MTVINWDIALHPLNWVTLFLMVFIAGIAIHLVLQYLAPAAAEANSNTQQ
jgi:hypothetical protein